MPISNQSNCSPLDHAKQTAIGEAKQFLFALQVNGISLRKPAFEKTGMASELEGSRRKTLQSRFPSLTKSGMNATATRNRDAASGRVERAKNSALQDAPVHLNESAAKDTAFIRTTERGALGPFRAATRTGAGNPFRSECARKR